MECQTSNFHTNVDDLDLSNNDDHILLVQLLWGNFGVGFPPPLPLGDFIRVFNYVYSLDLVCEFLFVGGGFVFRPIFLFIVFFKNLPFSKRLKGFSFGGFVGVSFVLFLGTEVVNNFRFDSLFDIYSFLSLSFINFLVLTCFQVAGFPYINDRY